MSRLDEIYTKYQITETLSSNNATNALQPNITVSWSIAYIPGAIKSSGKLPPDPKPGPGPPIDGPEKGRGILTSKK